MTTPIVALGALHLRLDLSLRGRQLHDRITQVAYFSEETADRLGIAHPKFPCIVRILESRSLDLRLEASE